jgi:hypothetical protein
MCYVKMNNFFVLPLPLLIHMTDNCYLIAALEGVEINQHIYRDKLMNHKDVSYFSRQFVEREEKRLFNKLITESFGDVKRNLMSEFNQDSCKPKENNYLMFLLGIISLGVIFY